MTEQTSEQLRKSYFKIKTSTVEHMKELLHDIKYTKHDELKVKIKELEIELENLKNTKKYWLVWDSEKYPEQVVLDCQNKLPILKEEKSRKIINDDSWESNLLIEWDNYHSLQVLNYTHKEAIDVIYIDPPYNTWNNDFVYNDKYIDKEDTYRHSKWLNFMEKRLKLAHNLLKEDWVIFISIDDNEQAQLKLLCDEIFWESSYIWTILWRRTESQNNSAKHFSTVWEYVLVYSKCERYNIEFNKINLSEKATKEYRYEDEKWKFRRWTIIDNTRWKNIYEVISPKWIKTTIKSIRNINWFKEKNFEWLIYWTNNWTPYLKIYLNLSEWQISNNWFDNAWVNEDAADFIRSIKINFDFSKPISLINKLLKLRTNQNSIILDFMAWSWTTWHAVLDLNKEDWWNRKFILCTNNENNICEEITYQRIKRVSNWYTNSKWKEIEGLGGNLRYYKTDFVEIENLKEITDQKKLELTYNAWELLAIKEWIYNELEKNNFWQIFESNN